MRPRILLPLAAALAICALPASAAPIAVKPADAPTIHKAIAAHKGHVVVVNFWATWCGPCVAEFPDLVKISNEYRGKGVVVMAVSADRKSDIATKVLPFLRSHHANFQAYLQQSSDPEVFINAFDPKWQGDLPRTLIYNKQGKLVRSLSGQQTLHSFAAAIKPLL